MRRTWGFPTISNLCKKNAKYFKLNNLDKWKARKNRSFPTTNSIYFGKKKTKTLNKDSKNLNYEWDYSTIHLLLLTLEGSVFSPMKPLSMLSMTAVLTLLRRARNSVNLSKTSISMTTLSLYLLSKNYRFFRLH